MYFNGLVHLIIHESTFTCQWSEITLRRSNRYVIGINKLINKLENGRNLCTFGRKLGM